MSENVGGTIYCMRKNEGSNIGATVQYFQELWNAR